MYWHVLVGDHPQVQGLAREAQERLSGFTGFHMTPLQRLHITTLAAGPADEITSDEMSEMLTSAELSLSKTPPITISLGRVLYHPEAIMLEVLPQRALDPLLEAAESATSAVTGRPCVARTSASSWTPHVTLCYSTAWQPAEPVITALGQRLRGCEATVDALSLVVQRGSEFLWDWHRAGTAHLRGARNDTQNPSP